MPIRDTLNRVRRAIRFGWRLFQLADTFAEKAGLLRFGLASIGACIMHGPSMNRDAEVSLQGTNYTVGLTNMELYGAVEVYQDRVYDRIDNFIPRPGWTVLDIGANIGLFALQQAQRGAQVYAFEPNADCCRRMLQTARRNDVAPALTVLDYAVGESPGAGSMSVPHGWTMAGSVHLGNEDTTESCPVKVTSLDHIIPTLPMQRIELLKIDAEGLEVDVLRGATHTLKIVDRIIVEYHSRDLLEQVKAQLQGDGFAALLQLDTTPELGIGLLYAQRASMAA